MPFIDWTDLEFGIGISQIDEQHKKLIDILNLLHSHMKEGKGKVIILQVLDELKNYTRYHFQAEEYLMGHNLYPKIQEHKDEHSKFEAEIEDLKQKFNTGHRTITTETFDFIKNWLLNHISVSDKNFGVYLKKK